MSGNEQWGVTMYYRRAVNQHSLFKKFHSEEAPTMLNRQLKTLYSEIGTLVQKDHNQQVAWFAKILKAAHWL